MDVILLSLSLMAASLLALVRGIVISIIIMQAVIAAQLLCGKLAYLLPEDSCSCIVLHTPFGKQVSVSGEDVAELCVSEL